MTLPGRWHTHTHTHTHTSLNVQMKARDYHSLLRSCYATERPRSSSFRFKRYQYPLQSSAIYAPVKSVTLDYKKRSWLEYLRVKWSMLYLLLVTNNNVVLTNARWDLRLVCLCMCLWMTIEERIRLQCQLPGKD